MRGRMLGYLHPVILALVKYSHCSNSEAADKRVDLLAKLSQVLTGIGGLLSATSRFTGQFSDLGNVDIDILNNRGLLGSGARNGGVERYDLLHCLSNLIQGDARSADLLYA